MKFLRNPIVVAILAAIAGVYSVWTALGSRSFRSYPATAAAPPPPESAAALTPAATLAALPGSTLPIANSPLPGGRTIDLPTVANLATRWIESPRRDPFRLDRHQAAAPSGPPASQYLSLRAIWRQTGSQLAIINNQILREGEILQGFAIETIEAESVWVRGTNGRERLTFPVAVGMIPIENVTTALDGPAPRQETITATLPIAPSP